MDVLQRIESERSVTILADGIKVLDRMAKVCVPLFEMGFDMEATFGTELTNLMTHFHSIRTATDQLRTELRQIQNAGFKARIRAIEGKIDKSEAELRQATSVLSAYLAKDNKYTEKLDEVVIPSTFYQDEQNNGGFTPLVNLNSTLHALLQLHQQHTMTTPEAETARIEQQKELERQEKTSSGELEQLRETLSNAKQNLSTSSNNYESNISSLKDSISNLEAFKSQTEAQLSDKLTSTLEISSKQYSTQMEDLSLKLSSIKKEISSLRYNTNTTLASLNRSLARHTTSMTELTHSYDSVCMHATDVITLLTHRTRLLQQNINLLNEHIEEFNAWWTKIQEEEDRKKEIKKRKIEGRIMMEEAGGVIEAAWRGYKFRLCGGIEKCRRNAKRRLRKSRGKGRSRSSRGSSRGSRSSSAMTSSRSLSPVRMAQQSEGSDMSFSHTSVGDSLGATAGLSEDRNMSPVPRSAVTSPSTGINDDVVDVE